MIKFEDRTVTRTHTYCLSEIVCDKCGKSYSDEDVSDGWIGDRVFHVDLGFHFNDDPRKEHSRTMELCYDCMNKLVEYLSTNGYKLHGPIDTRYYKGRGGWSV